MLTIFSICLFTCRQGELWDDKGEGSIDANIDKAFAALRRFVNDEINEMIFAVRMAEVLLKPGISKTILLNSSTRTLTLL